MQFSVSQSSFAMALGVVSKGLASSAQSAMLAGVLIKAEDGVIELQTTNQTIHVRNRIPAMVTEPGAVVVSGRMLSSIMKTLPDAALSVETDGSQLALVCEQAHFKMNTLDAADFPEFPTYALERSVELPADVLRAMEQKVARAVSKDTSRPILTGILLTVAEGVLRLVATDTFRMAVCDTQVEENDLAQDFEIIVPAAAFHDVLGFSGSGSGAQKAQSILLGSTQNQVVFVSGDVTYVSRRIEGTFPNFRSIMPKGYQTQIVCDVATLDAVMHRVSTIAQSHPSVVFDVDADGQLMTLSAKSVDMEEATETMDAEIKGENTRIVLNYRYVFDCLTALKDQKTVTLELRSPREPALFTSQGDISYIYLLMPLRD